MFGVRLTCDVLAEDGVGAGRVAERILSIAARFAALADEAVDGDGVGDGRAADDGGRPLILSSAS